ncbi:hypothetical protein AMJ57_04050 [Parcubacteria bacterium SG8_24]|nr:MAG: hypothetical protein AMJ57_04050 [Parcubacteria bacterium SG8_24]
MTATDPRSLSTRQLLRELNELQSRFDGSALSGEDPTAIFVRHLRITHELRRRGLSGLQIEWSRRNLD